MHIFYHNKKCVFRKAGSKYEYKFPTVCYTYNSSKVSGVATLIQWLDIQFKRLGDGNCCGSFCWALVQVISFMVFSLLFWVRILSQSHCTLIELLQDSQTHTHNFLYM